MGEHGREHKAVEWRIERGATWSIFTRVAIGVVDQAGERPD
ncbi:hypothetical protein [Lentzea alba]|nr:hypothetical protein [Lentzea alba]